MRLEDYKEQWIGKVFGRLTVIDVIQNYNSRGEKKGFICICRCSCGKLKSVTTNHLGKDTFSCGCLRDLNLKVGDRSGNLVIISESGTKPTGEKLFSCRCDCGNLTVVTGSNFRTTKSCGCLCKENSKIRAREIHRVSQFERSVLDLLREYSPESTVFIDDYEYDIRIGNFLIECNGSYWHASESTRVLKRVRDELFHYNLYITAKSLGYNLIQVWDYQSLDFIQKLLHEQLSGTARIEDYISSDGLLCNDYGFSVDNEVILDSGRWIEVSHLNVVSYDPNIAMVKVYNSGYSKITV